VVNRGLCGGQREPPGGWSLGLGGPCSLQQSAGIVPPRGPGESGSGGDDLIGAYEDPLGGRLGCRARLGCRGLTGCGGLTRCGGLSADLLLDHAAHITSPEKFRLSKYFR
jgi:hypothetical protein